MTKEEALKLVFFDHYCTCGGFAWPTSGRDPRRPHTDWCPQMKQYNEWYDALHPVDEESPGQVEEYFTQRLIDSKQKIEDSLEILLGTKKALE